MAKKMILIDPRLLEKPYLPPDTLKENLGELDTEMQRILEREDLSVVDKAKLYNSTLQRYLNRFEQYKQRPLGFVDMKPTTPETPTIQKEDVPDKLQHTPEVTTIATEEKQKKKHSNYKSKLRPKASKIPKPKWEEWSPSKKS